MNSRYKYNISINVVPVIKHNLDLDYIDLIIFDFIKDFANSNYCTKIQTTEGLYFWISHTSIMNQLPLLKITSKAGIIKRVDNLINAGILEKSKQSKEFGKSLYRFGKNYDKMIFSNSELKKSGTNKSLEGCQRKLVGGTNESLEDNNNNIYNIIEDKDIKENQADSKSVPPPIDFKKLVSFFNQNRGAMPEVKVLSDSRRKAVNLIIKRHSKEDLIKVIEKVKGSAFLQGDNDRQWLADFDWITKPKNFVKILEGNYDNKKTENATTRRDYAN